MTDVHRTEIDGVPTFWADAPGHLAGGLIFRVGQADETLVTRGQTHLIEHLALAKLGHEHLAYNGTVDQVSTTFLSSGQPAEVRDFINGVVTALADLPMDRLEREVRILDTESSRSGGRLAKTLLNVRFGTAGHGLPAFPEMGLRRIDPGALDAWRRAFFNRANVAMWFTGEPPVGLDLSGLPEGRHFAPPEPEPLPQQMPAWYPVEGNLVAVSFLGDRSQAWSLSCGLMQQRLQARLREQDGRSYEIGGTYDRLTDTIAHVLHYADTLENEAEDVRDAFITEANRFAMHGATADEWDELRTLRRRSMEDPYAAGRRAAYEATEWVCFRSERSQAFDDEEFEGLTVEDLRPAWRHGLDSAIWAAPRGVGVYDRRYVRIPDCSTWGTHGIEVHRPPGTAKRLASEVLVVGEHAVTIRLTNGQPLTIPYADCRAVEMWTDGARRMWAPDGVTVFLHPAAWINGAQVIADLDRRFPTRLFVPLDKESGYEHSWEPPPGPQA